jgi:hypothetical protein
MVKQRGYGGGPDHFRHVVARYRPRPVAEAYLRLRTLPGEHYGQTPVMVRWEGAGQVSQLPSGLTPHNSYSDSSQVRRSLGRRTGFGVVEVGDPARASAARFIPRSICT